MSGVLDTFRRLTNELRDSWNGDAAQVLEQYQRWSTQSADFLGSMLSSGDVGRLLLTQRHWALMSMTVNGNGPVVHDMVRAEHAELKRAFEALTKEFEALRARCAALPETVVVADTNFYLHHEHHFDGTDWPAITGAPGDLRLLVPIAVVRELDKAKRTAKNITVSDTNTEPIRTRARVVSRRLRELFADPDAVVTLMPGVEAELLLDPIAHQPLGDVDSEIIDRALAARSIADRPISVVTHDGGMQFSARTAGLGVIPLFDSP